jgi:hypothetical protein
LPLHDVPEEQLRTHCRKAIEALEIWLRSGIDHSLTLRFGNDSINATDNDGKFIIKKGIRNEVARRQKLNPGRYTRPIDAMLLDEEIELVTEEDGVSLQPGS